MQTASISAFHLTRIRIINSIGAFVLMPLAHACEIDTAKPAFNSADLRMTGLDVLYRNQRRSRTVKKGGCFRQRHVQGELDFLAIAAFCTSKMTCSVPIKRFLVPREELVQKASSSLTKPRSCKAPFQMGPAISILPEQSLHALSCCRCAALSLPSVKTASGKCANVLQLTHRNRSDWRLEMTRWVTPGIAWIRWAFRRSSQKHEDKSRR